KRTPPSPPPWPGGEDRRREGPRIPLCPRRKRRLLCSWMVTSLLQLLGVRPAFLYQLAQQAVLGGQHPVDPADDGAGSAGPLLDVGVDALVHKHLGDVVALFHRAELGIAAH